MRSELNGRSVDIYTLSSLSLAPKTELRSRENAMPHGCYDCGSVPAWMIIEDDGTAWLWCGHCDIGG